MNAENKQHVCMWKMKRPNDGYVSLARYGTDEEREGMGFVGAGGYRRRRRHLANERRGCSLLRA